MPPEPMTHVELRSEEIQEIMAAVPRWMVRWGSTVILVIIGGLLGLGWVVRYPDIVAGQAVLTTPREPAYLYAKANGNVRRLYVRPNAWVREGQLLAEISNPVRKPQLDALRRHLQAVYRSLDHHDPELRLDKAETSYGEVQPNYNRLVENVNNLRQLYAPYHAHAVARLRADIAQYTRLDGIYRRKLALAEQEQHNAGRQLAANQVLLREKAIAQLDLIAQESSYNQKLTEVENIRQAIVQNQLQLSEQRRRLEELEFNQQEAIRKLRASILAEAKTIEAFMQTWQQNNALVAPTAGQVVFIEKFSEGSYARTDKALLAIVPAYKRIVAKVKVPSARYGKVQVGQRVRLTLSNYPFQEYGYVIGHVRQKSYLPVEDKYELLADVAPQLITSYGRPVEFKPNMPATAEVIVDDQRLLEKLLYSVRQLLRR